VLVSFSVCYFCQVYGYVHIGIHCSCSCIVVECHWLDPALSCTDGSKSVCVCVGGGGQELVCQSCLRLPTPAHRPAQLALIMLLTMSLPTRGVQPHQVQGAALMLLMLLLLHHTPTQLLE
jgi:hypothetical protein